MFFSRNRRNTEALPSLEEELAVNNTPQILETLDKLRLPPEKLVITGSAAITLLGLERRANDLDIVAHPSVLQELEETGALNTMQATKAEFSRPGRLHFAAASSPLASELFGHKEGAAKLLEFDDFLEHHASRTPDGIFITTPQDLLSAKRNRRIGNSRDPKHARKLAQDLYDTDILREYLQSQRKR